MPIYTYICDNGHQFDLTQTIKELPIRQCQECAAPVERILSSAALVFKGAGWTPKGK